jgi:transcriptional/translational regulatory protein YebC/TACO1
VEEKDLTVVSAELSMVPNSTMMLDQKAALTTLRLLDRLEELDDVQRVFTNADFPDEALERYRTQS